MMDEEADIERQCVSKSTEKRRRTRCGHSGLLADLMLSYHNEKTNMKGGREEGRKSRR